MSIPAEAVEAAAKAYRREFPYDENEGYVVKLILEAAGPHMHRTITTAAELDALGRSAVIMQPGGTILVNDGQVEEPWASYVEDPFGGPIWTDSSHVTLPVTVLHEGDPK